MKYKLTLTSLIFLFLFFSKSYFMIDALKNKGIWVNPDFDLAKVINKCVEIILGVDALEAFVSFEPVDQYGDLFLSEHVSYERALSAMSIASSGLHQAVLWGQFDKIAHFLCIEKINVNSRNCLGQTPLHIAIIAGKLSIFILILSFEPELNLIDIFGMTPYDHAILSNNLDCARFLEVLSAEKQADLSKDL